MAMPKLNSQSPTNPQIRSVAYRDPRGCIVLMFINLPLDEYRTQIKRRESKSSAGVVSLVTYILFIQYILSGEKDCLYTTYELLIHLTA